MTQVQPQNTASSHAQDSLLAGQEREEVFLAGGCFWGVEKFMRATPGVTETEVGYMGGSSADPSYVEVCTGTTGHAETVRVIYDPKAVSVEEILATFFENHDPTQLNRQGNDIGTQYRSAVWTTSAQQYEAALKVKDRYAEKLASLGYGPVATAISSSPAPPFHRAEEYHQRYLEKNPGGYCNHGFNGVACPRGLL